VPVDDGDSAISVVESKTRTRCSPMDTTIVSGPLIGFDSTFFACTSRGFLVRFLLAERRWRGGGAR
jgi:hypothetical protein